MLPDQYKRYYCWGAHVLVVLIDERPWLLDTVKLICEAGTGYNNIDLAAAAARGITVCNVPCYSTVWPS